MIRHARARPASRLAPPAPRLTPPASRLARPRRRFALAAIASISAGLVAAAATVPASAHDLFLLPDTPHPAAGTPFMLEMHLGGTIPGETVPWRAARITEFFLTDRRGRVDLDAARVAGGPPAAQVELRGEGTAVVALSTDAAYLELPSAEFEKYLKAEGHDAALRARAAAGRSGDPGRERYTRHVKVVVNAGGPSASVALSRAGLALEIVPETDLARLRPGGALPVRVFYRGSPYIDGQVCATHEGWSGDHDTYAWCGRLDGAGRASVPIGAAGWQVIRTTRMIPIHDDPKADWHSFWAALTFRVEEPATGEGAPGAAPAGQPVPPTEGPTP